MQDRWARGPERGSRWSPLVVTVVAVTIMLTALATTLKAQPLSSQLLYMSAESQLTVLDTATGSVSTVVDQVTARHAAVSPDGQWLAFVTGPRVRGNYQPEDGNLWVARTDGSYSTLVTRGPVEAEGASVGLTWTPDSALLAFAARPDPSVTGSFGTPSIFVFDTQERAARKLLDSAHAPAWSPDGALLAFHKLVPKPECSWNCADGGIWVVGRDGANEASILASRSGEIGQSPAPRWSANGQWVLATDYVFTDPRVRVAGRTGGEQPFEMTKADWAGTGSTLVLAANPSNAAIQRRDVPGPAVALPCCGAGKVVALKFSPTGGEVAVAVVDEDVATRTPRGVVVWLVPTTGEPRRIVERPDATVDGLAWGPDGSLLAVETYPGARGPGVVPVTLVVTRDGVERHALPGDHALWTTTPPQPLRLEAPAEPPTASP